MTNTYRYTSMLVTVLIIGILVGAGIGLVLVDHYMQLDLSLDYFEDGSFLLKGCNPWDICN